MALLSTGRLLQLHMPMQDDPSSEKKLSKGFVSEQQMSQDWVNMHTCIYAPLIGASPLPVHCLLDGLIPRIPWLVAPVWWDVGVGLQGGFASVCWCAGRTSSTAWPETEQCVLICVCSTCALACSM